MKTVILGRKKKRTHLWSVFPVILQLSVALVDNMISRAPHISCCLIRCSQFCFLCKYKYANQRYALFKTMSKREVRKYNLDITFNFAAAESSSCAGAGVFAPHS